MEVNIKYNPKIKHQNSLFINPPRSSDQDHHGKNSEGKSTLFLPVNERGHRSDKILHGPPKL